MNLYKDGCDKKHAYYIYIYSRSIPNTDPTPNTIMENMNITHSDKEIEALISALQTRPASILCLDICQFTSVFLVRNLLNLLPTAITFVVREGETTPGWTDRENTIDVLSGKKNNKVTEFLMQKAKKLHVLWKNKDQSDVLHIPALPKGAFLTIQPVDEVVKANPAIELIMDSIPYSLLLAQCNLAEFDYKRIFTGVANVILDNCTGLEKMCNDSSNAVFGVESVVINHAVNPHSLINGVFARVKTYVSFLECAFAGSPVFHVKTSASVRMVHCTFEKETSLSIDECGPFLFLAYVDCPVSFSTQVTNKVDALAVLACRHLSNPCPIIFQFRDNMRLFYYSLDQNDPNTVQSISKVCGQGSEYLETIILQDVGTVDRIINAPRLTTLALCDSSAADNALSLPELKHVFLRGNSVLGKNQRDTPQKLKIDRNEDAFCFDESFVEVCGQLFVTLTCPW